MPISFGQNNTQKFVFGNSLVNRIYNGPSLVFNAAVPPPVSPPVITIIGSLQDDTADLDACFAADRDPVPLSDESTALFSIGSTATTGSRTYQWQKSSDNGANWTNITDSRTYRITTGFYNLAPQGESSSLWLFSYPLSTGMANLTNGDKYRVIITSTIDPSVVVTSNAATLTVPVPAVTITQQPSNYVAINGSAGFSISATKNFIGYNGELSYQWQRSDDGGNSWSNWLVGPTYYHPTLQLSGLTAADNGSKWRCLAYSYIFCGSNQVQPLAYSNAATLTVT